jgi:protein-L-isoaspartate(D-aspartate) O-methyltransferase
MISRRELLGGAIAAVTAGRLGPAKAEGTTDAGPPMDSRANFIAWMRANRGEDANFLGQRWDFYLGLKDQIDQRSARAFLLTPREEFVPKASQSQAYATTHLDIGYGGFITDPVTVARMNSALEVQPGDRVLEIGTGSGYQSAYLSNLSGQIHSIEIIQPLYRRAGDLYAGMIERGYGEYRAITQANADGYYGWQDAGPFDKIIVTCGIDHIPPPLLQQLTAGGTMLIPVGPPGGQRVLKIAKKVAADGTFSVARFDIFNGVVLNFMPLASMVDNKIVGTHYSG